MATTYDVVVIGGGPNGLTAAAYLGKAGLRVLVLEKRTEAGGGLATEEATLSDYLHNTHAIYHMMVDYAPIYGDLKLEENYGLKHVLPPIQVVMPFSDGKALCLYTDVDKTCSSIARFSTRDANAYRKMHHQFQNYMDAFLAPATYVPPLSALEQAAKLEQSELGQQIAGLSEKSPKAIVDDLFENEHVRTAMLYLACRWGLKYDLEGVGYLAVLYLNRATNHRLCLGGSHMLCQALVKVILENGGMVLTNQRIKRIVVESGAARRIEREDGTVIEASKAIISTIDPLQTFIKLVGEGNLEGEFALRVKDWKWEEWSRFSLHLALEGAPNFSAAASDPEINKGLVYVIGYEATEDLINHWESMDKGKPGEGGFECCFPTIHDPSQAPPGRHTATISQMAPYRLKDGPDRWYDLKLKQEQTERCVGTLERYAPGIKNLVLDTYVSTPLDIENKFADMVEGSIKQGAYHPFQMGYLRPNEECSLYKTPIKNLYLGGASCHPGGLVIFGPGYLAAKTVAEDLGVQKWWSEPEIVINARQRGLL